MEQVASFTAYVENFEDESIDPDLSEFTVFTINTLTVSDTGIMARWETAPRSTYKERLYAGTQSIEANSVSFGTEASIIDTTLFTGPGTSPLLLDNASTYDVVQTALMEAMPMPLEPATETQRATDGSTSPTNVTGRVVTVSTDQHYQSVTVGANGSVVLDDGVTILVDEDIVLTNDARLLVNNDVTMVVFGDFSLTDSAIEVLRRGSLTLYVGGDIVFDHGYVGDRLRTTSSINVYDLNATSRASYLNPERVRIFGLQAAELAGAGPQLPLHQALENYTMANVSYLSPAFSATGLAFRSVGRIVDATSLVAELRSFADDIEAMPLTSFLGADDTIKADRQRDLALAADTAANEIELESDFNEALNKVQEISIRVDLDNADEDWMVDSTDRSTVLSQATDLSADVSTADASGGVIDRYTVWRLRNANEGTRNVVLRDSAGTFSLRLTIPGDSDLFVRSPVVAGTAQHQMLFGGSVLYTQNASSAVFADPAVATVGMAAPDEAPVWTLDTNSVIKARRVLHTGVAHDRR